MLFKVLRIKSRVILSYQKHTSKFGTHAVDFTAWFFLTSKTNNFHIRIHLLLFMLCLLQMHNMFCLIMQFIVWNTVLPVEVSEVTYFERHYFLYASEDFNPSLPFAYRPRQGHATASALS